jgi:copper chaperone
MIHYEQEGIHMAKETSILSVPGMSCSYCEAAIKKAVGALNGVDKVSVDLSSKKVTVDYDQEKVGLKAIKDAIEDQGHDIG